MKKKKIVYILQLLLHIFILTLLVFGVTLVRDLSDNNYRIAYLSETSYWIDMAKNMINGKNLIKFFKPNLYNFCGWIVAIYYLLINAIKSFKQFGKQKYQESTKYGSHGTARFQTVKEERENYEKDQKGWFLGSVEAGESYKLGMKALYHPVDGELNMQMTVVGSPGSRKTTGFVLPNLMNIPYAYKKAGESLPDIIVTDPKSELYCLTSPYLEKQGYEVYVVDFIHLKYGEYFNCLDFIETDKELMEVCQGYVASVESSTGGGKGDAFWAEQEGQALAALVGAVKQMNPSNKHRFEDVLSFLTNELTSEDGAIDMIKSRQKFDAFVTGAPLQLWKNFLLICKSDNTAASILGGLAGKLKYFAIEEVKKITSKTTIDITQLGRKKEKPMAIFLLMSDSEKTFSPIVNLIVNTIFKRLYRTAYDYNNKLQVPVYFILEEMANIGKISGIKEMLGTMRGRRIYPMMIWQSYAQMKDVYKEAWENIVSQCDTQVYLGVADHFTAEYVSKVLGKTTIKVDSQSESEKGVIHTSKSGSESYTGRQLLFPDEIMTMDNSKYVFTQRARHPALIGKVQYEYWKPGQRICEERNIQDTKLLELEKEVESQKVVIEEKVEVEEQEINREEKKSKYRTFGSQRKK